jgi:diadenosine tetraphosphatase ApaH/serine/threonine PP2A family protein phosphatase
VRIALIADVHANLAALEAVLEAIARARVDRLVCLGDLVGYNAEPSACTTLVRANADVAVAGNHDRSVAAYVVEPGTSSHARMAQAWTRAHLAPATLAYLSSLPSHVIDERAGYIAAHGSFLSDSFVNGYVSSTMLEANLRAIAARERWPALAFCGHTHVAMLGELASDDEVRESALRTRASWQRDARAVLVNPGSVGQPRDGDPRASFALVDTEERTAEIHRVAYDVERAATAILRAGLPSELAARLREGR